MEVPSLKDKEKTVNFILEPYRAIIRTYRENPDKLKDKYVKRAFKEIFKVAEVTDEYEKRLSVKELMKLDREEQMIILEGHVNEYAVFLREEYLQSTES